MKFRNKQHLVKQGLCLRLRASLSAYPEGEIILTIYKKEETHAI
jgi:hypothetical protein